MRVDVATEPHLGETRLSIKAVLKECATGDVYRPAEIDREAREIKLNRAEPWGALNRFIPVQPIESIRVPFERLGRFRMIDDGQDDRELKRLPSED